MYYAETYLYYLQNIDFNYNSLSKQKPFNKINKVKLTVQPVVYIQNFLKVYSYENLSENALNTNIYLFLLLLFGIHPVIKNKYSKYRDESLITNLQFNLCFNSNIKIISFFFNFYGFYELLNFLKKNVYTKLSKSLILNTIYTDLLRFLNLKRINNLIILSNFKA
jgi:hypothetical protein